MQVGCLVTEAAGAASIDPVDSVTIVVSDSHPALFLDLRIYVPGARLDRVAKAWNEEPPLKLYVLPGVELVIVILPLFTVHPG